MSAKAKPAETAKATTAEESESKSTESVSKNEKEDEKVDTTAVAETDQQQLATKDADIKKDETEETNQNDTANPTEIELEPENKRKRLRKSVRSTRFKSKATTNRNAAAAANNGAGNSNGGGNNGTTTKSQPKGRNRRSMFKKQPHKLPVVQVTTRYVESVFYKGTYMQTGDIVSLMDAEQNVYYAQIRGLLIDNYSEKSAFLTWLLPTLESPDPKTGFDPATYLIGPDEELSRKLSYMEFVMHAPSNYYHDRTTPFPLPDYMEQDSSKGGYIWTRLPQYKRRA